MQLCINLKNLQNNLWGVKIVFLSSTRFEFVSAPSGENIKFCFSDHIWQGNLLHYLWPFLKKFFQLIHNVVLVSGNSKVIQLCIFLDSFTLQIVTRYLI